MENKKRYTKFVGKNIVYKTKEGKVVQTPWAMVEGYIVKEVEIKKDKNDNSYVICRMSTNYSPERQFDYLSKNLKDNYETQEVYFITLKAFDKVAERFAKIAQKGKRMLVWGEFGKNEYKSTKDGKNVVDYFINVEDFYPLSYKKNSENLSTEPEFEEIEGEEIPF